MRHFCSILQIQHWFPCKAQAKKPHNSNYSWLLKLWLINWTNWFIWLIFNFLKQEKNIFLWKIIMDFIIGNWRPPIKFYLGNYLCVFSCVFLISWGDRKPFCKLRKGASFVHRELCGVLAGFSGRWLLSLINHPYYLHTMKFVILRILICAHPPCRISAMWAGKLATIETMTSLTEILQVQWNEFLVTHGWLSGTICR